jgi:hypothetical protein
VLGYTYDAVVTGGKFGLLSWTGTNVFRNLNVTSNDPELHGHPDLPQPQVVQGPAVPPGPTWLYTTTFTNGPIYLDAPISGSWLFGKNGYTGTAPAGGIAIAPIDPGLALGLPPGTFTFPDGTAVDLKMVLNPVNGRAGVVFDMTSDGSFKFAALLYDKHEVAIGHYTTAGGFVIDATQSYTFQNNTSVYFEVVLHGDLVAVSILSGPPFGLTYAYGTVVTRGQFGLLSWTGTATFSSLVINTDAPNLLDAPQNMLAASAPTSPAVGVTDLTMADADSELPAAIGRLTAMYSLDAAQVAQLSAAAIEIGDLPNSGLGITVDGTITLSPDAAGWGWFIDPNPYGDSAFSLATTNGLAAAPGSPAYGEMDLLTVEMHELAHLLSYGDTTSGLMSEYLAPGIRLAPPVNTSLVSQPAAAALALDQTAVATVGDGIGSQPAVEALPTNAAVSAKADADTGGFGAPATAPASAPATGTKGHTATTAAATGLGGDAVTFGPLGNPLSALPSDALATSIIVSPPPSSVVVAPDTVHSEQNATYEAYFGGNFVDFGAPLGWSSNAAAAPAAPSLPPADIADVPAAGPDSPRVVAPAAPNAGKAAVIAWNTDHIVGLDSFDAGSPGRSGDWLNDFVNHLGQSEDVWNPNAVIRVWPTTPSAPGD